MEDIEIQTMESDIEAIKAGGEYIETNQPMSEASEFQQTSDVQNGQIVGENQNNKKITILILSVLVAALGIGFIAYYLALKIIK